MPVQFPYERYNTLPEQLPVYYPAGEESFARQVFATIHQACLKLSQLFSVDGSPDFDVLIVDMDDWSFVPHNESEEVDTPHPYMTDATSPPSLVVPVAIDPILGEATPEKISFMLYHELVVAFLENDPRSWPEESPLWSDEWQFKFAALWLSQQLDGVEGVVNKDVRAEYAEHFEPEPDGKTPVTIRGFDWYEDTTPEDYLVYELLLEQFVADLLKRFSIDVLLRFLDLYRVECDRLLSDEVTAMLETALGPESGSWLEELIYF